MKNFPFCLLFVLVVFKTNAQHYFGVNTALGMSSCFRTQNTYDLERFEDPILIAGIGSTYLYQMNSVHGFSVSLNFHLRGENLRTQFDNSCINQFYGFIRNSDISKSNEYSRKDHYYILQVPLMYQFNMKTKKGNAWVLAAGASINYVMKYYFHQTFEGFLTDKGYYDRTDALQENGNRFVPSALLEVGFRQRLKKRRQLVYSIVYDQHLSSIWPNVGEPLNGTPLFQDLNYAVSLCVKYNWRMHTN